MNDILFYAMKIELIERSLLHLNINMHNLHQILNQNRAIKMPNLTIAVMLLLLYIIKLVSLLFERKYFGH
jgi:hypothetical protein